MILKSSSRGWEGTVETAEQPFLPLSFRIELFDSGVETPVTSLPDDLREPGQLENLVRYRISSNDISLNIKSLANIAPFIGKPKPATYHARMVICRRKEFIPGLGEGWITFNHTRKLQLEEFLHVLKVSIKNAHHQ